MRATSTGAAIAVAFLVFLSAVAAATSTPGPSLPSSPLALLAERPASHPTEPVVTRTFDLFNESVFSGYFGGTATLFPAQVAYDSLNHTVWVAGGNVGTTGVDVVNPATGLGVRILPASEPVWVAYDNSSDTMWVTGGVASNTVTVYNATTYLIEATVEVGTTPEWLTYDYQTETMYVSNFGSANVSLVSGVNYTRYATVNVGDGPEAIAFDSGNAKLYVYTDSPGLQFTYFNAVAPFDPTSFSLTSGFGGVESMVYDSTTNRLYAAGVTPGVIIVDPVTESAPNAITLPKGSNNTYNAVTVDPTNDALFVSSFSTGNVSEYLPAPTVDTNDTNLTATISLSDAADPIGIAFDSQLSRVVVVDNDQSGKGETNLSEISATSHQVVGSISLAPLPLGVAYSPTHSEIYVYDGEDGELLALNASTLTVERTAFIGYTGEWTYSDIDSMPAGAVVYDPTDDAIFVDFEHYFGGASGVARVDASTFAVTVLPSREFADPAGMAYDPVSDTVYVADFYSGNVTVLSGATGALVTNVTVGPNPVGLAYDSTNDSILVAVSENNSVAEISASTNTVIHSLTMGTLNEPFGVAYDPSNDDAYVANSGAGTVSVINVSAGTARGPISVPGYTYPHFVTYDPVNETLLVTEPMSPAYSDSVLDVVNTTNQTFFDQLDFGESLTYVSYVPALDAAFVSGTLPGSVYQLGNATVSSPPPPALGATLTALPSSVQVGSTTSLRTSVTGATGSLSYAYSTPPPGCASADVATLPCTPSAPGSYVIGVNVTQSGGGSASAVTRLNVTARTGPLSVELSAVPATIANGSSSTITATVSGGTAPFSYAYSTLPSGCSAGNLSSFVCTPSAAGSYVVGVNVTDDHGNVSSATARLNVTSTVTGFSVTFVATPSTIGLGNSTNLTVTIRGSPLGPVTYHYSNLPPGCTAASGPLIVCTPTAAGTYSPSVTANDTSGQSGSAVASLLVTSTTHPSSPSGSSSTWVWVAVGVAVIAVLFLIVLLARRRKKEPPTPAGPTPPATEPAAGPP